MEILIDVEYSQGWFMFEISDWWNKEHKTELRRSETTRIFPIVSDLLTFVAFISPNYNYPKKSIV